MACAVTASGHRRVDEERVGVAVDDAMTAARTASAARRMTCWPAWVIAFATAGENSRDAGDPSTPKSEFIRILIAWAPMASPAALRRRALLPQARDQRGQDAGLVATERGAARGRDHRDVWRRRGHDASADRC